MRVYISLNGEGLGHYSRAVSVYEEALSRGHEAVMATYGTAYKIAKKEGINVKKVLREVVMAGNMGRFSLGKTLIKSSGLPIRMYKSYKHEKLLMKGYDIIVSDSRVTTVLAGYRSKKPVFLLCNQTKGKSSFSKSSKQMTGKTMKNEERERMEKIEEEILSKLRNMKKEINLRLIEQSMDLSLFSQYQLADEILVGDFKPPETIAMPLLSHKTSVKKKTIITGPLNRMVNGYRTKKWSSLGFKDKRKKRKKIFVTIGGQLYRKGIIPRLIDSLMKIDEDILFAHFTIKKKIRRKNVLLKPFDRETFGYLANSDLIIIPAGHSGIMETMITETPALLMPDAMQPEQQSNAERFRKLGFGEYLVHEQLDNLPEMIEFMIENLDKYKKKMKGLNKRAKTTDNGPKNALRRMEDMYDRYYSW